MQTNFAIKHKKMKLKTALFLLLCPLTSCAQDIKKTSDLMTCEPGWDIYTAGTYRYGPCFIQYEDGSIEGWFAATGGEYGDVIYNEKGDKSPLKIASYNSIAQSFEVGYDFYQAKICCPTWNSDDQTVTIAVYPWKTTYKRTITQEPLYTKKVNMKDNGWIPVYYSPEAETDASILFPTGKYLILLKDGSSTAGVWYFTKRLGKFNGTAFQNGNPVDGSYQVKIQERMSDVDIYWDKATYQRSTDGGKTWSKEETALLPTQGAQDQLSVCDPGLYKWNGYYYCGYTSTIDTRGTDNDLYIARSTSPTGPWEKWNGTGWGGQPKPIIVYTGDNSKWGIGEPSMVVKDGTLYLYYTYDEGTPTTRLATVDVNDENWPAHLQKQGTVINKRLYTASDHCDVKYCDAIGKFIAVHTSNRMTQNGYINVWISDDGKNFTRLGKLEGTTGVGLHNCGISGDEIGHIDLQKPQFIAYAYGIDSWGVWNTHLQPLKFNETLTGLLSPRSSKESQTGYYDLQGRKVEKNKKGIIIEKGKKKLNKK